ncbi:MAG: hypothetical protein GY884_07495 [Proteobacteria bacterium]|nr:hypothetical protein [Pseudomonadota bacterium]
MILLLSLACTDPEAIAVAACQAVPTVSPDAASVALLTPLITAKDLAAVTGAEPTAGQAAVGDLSPLRAGTTCTVESVEGAGSGAWAVALKRSAPSVGSDGALGAAVDTEFTWQVTDAEGGRAAPGLVAAAAMRKSIAEARAEGDVRRAAATTRTLAKSFPDPTLTVDVALAEAELERDDYRDQLTAAFDGADDTNVQGHVENAGDRALTGVVVTATFQVSGSPVDSVQAVGDLPAGGSVPFEIPITAGAEGSVKFTASDFVFAD